MNKKVVLAILVVFAVILLAFAITHKMRQGNVAAIPAQTSPPMNQEAKDFYENATRLKDSNQLVEAKQIYQELLVKYSDVQDVDAIQKDLGEVNLSLIKSGIVVPDKTVVHEVVAGDSLGKLAKKYDTTIELIKASNRLKSDVIRLGQKLRIWTGKFNVLVDKSQNVLILKDQDEVVKVYNVSTGENNSTPVGTFTITTRLTDPVWFNRGAIVPPESPANVLGTRWLGFDLPGYGIHGTVEPETIGQQVTAGCVRMANPDVEELYDLLPMGIKVTIVD